MTDNLEDFDTDVEFDLEDQLSPEEMSARVPTFSQEKLCEIVVCERYFGCYKDLALQCMEELARRRINGEQFDFENYIEKSFNELPKLEFAVPDISAVLRQFIGKKVGL